MGRRRPVYCRNSQRHCLACKTATAVMEAATTTQLLAIKFLQVVCLLAILPAPVVHAQIMPTTTMPSRGLADGDLLIGRGQWLYASSTCGLIRPENFCSLNVEGQECRVCDSKRVWDLNDNPYSHRIQNVVGKIRRPKLRYKSWWMSEPGKENVSITLNLESTFHFTHLIMEFKSSRPKAFYIERSKDLGRTWLPYRYFAQSCKEVFPGVKYLKPGIRAKLGEVVCTNQNTAMSPLTKGQVSFQVLNDLEVINMTSSQLSPYISLTNLRIVFVKYHTFSDDIQKQDSSVNSKYYYAIYEMNVHGTCICNNHADHCGPSQPDLLDQSEPDMVHGKCLCVRNTEGNNCERCKPLFNQVPWREGRDCKACECNMHSDRCRFDKNLYKRSNSTYGGVCVNCKHNTEGRECHQCRSGYYRNYEVEIWSPMVCRRCNCDTAGTIGNVETNCDQETYKSQGKIAGQCACKENVVGRRCDRCKDGFWDISKSNDKGCRPCGCKVLGTRGNKGCHQITGKCDCKENVMQPRCEECQDGFYNLTSSNPKGCSPCRCLDKASYTPVCDKNRGKCSCRTGMEGRRCNKVKQGYFLPNLRIEAQIFDAEKQPGVNEQGNQIVVYPVPKKPEDKLWAGTGGVRLKSDAEFVISTQPNKLRPGYYSITITYRTENTSLAPNRKWPVWVRLERKPDDPGSICSPGSGRQTLPEWNEIKLKPTAKDDMGVHQFDLPVCISGDNLISVGVQPDATKPTPNANLVIDAIILSENVTKRMMPERGRTVSQILTKEQINTCLDYFKSTVQSGFIPDFCEEMKITIAYRITDQPEKCACNISGSNSTECLKIGGQCPCRPNVVGRKCNTCRPNYYGFGKPGGCLPCNCHPQGSITEQCNVNTGQCECQPNGLGRTCGDCKIGFWQFPVCVKCHCNNYAKACRDSDGVCLNCTKNTAGDNCERCKDGYFGDPLNGIRCRPCMCPGGLDSGFQHARTCRLIPGSNPPRAACQCKIGYEGDNCNRCKMNWFGRPNLPGGSCQKCGCNGNIDMLTNNSCDAITGRCMKCLYSTAGYNCEKCEKGFHGNATRLGGCIPCVCNELGTDPTTLLPGGNYECDRKTGMCKCLPNVRNNNCNECMRDSWDMREGKGCKKCNCDKYGSYGEDCSFDIGTCSCKPGRGGDKCDACSDLYYGNPLVKGGCKLCNCNMTGSTSEQCDRRSGKCSCIVGVDGQKCDRCARGTRGILPNCEPCGECWLNWDRIIQELYNKTVALRVRAEKLASRGGLTGNYGDQITNITSKLDTIAKILSESNVSSADVQSTRALLNDVRDALNDQKLGPNGTISNDVQKLLKTGETEAGELETKVKALQALLQEVNDKINKMDAEQKKVKSTSPQGNYEAIMRNRERVKKASEKIKKAERSIEMSAGSVKSTRTAFDAKYPGLNKTYTKLRSDVDQVKKKMSKVREQIPKLNSKVCGGNWQDMVDRSNFCHATCGGASCMECGTRTTCKDSLVRVTEDANTRQADAAQVMKSVRNATNQLTSLLYQGMDDSQQAKDETNELNRKTKELFNKVNQQNKNAQNLLALMNKFVSNPDRVTAKKLENEINRTMEIELGVKQDEVNTLADDIERYSQQYASNITKILEKTRNERLKAQSLLERAKIQLKEVQDLRKDADTVEKNQKDIDDAWNYSRTVINKLEDRIQSIKNNSAKLGKLLTKANMDLSSYNDKYRQLVTKIKNLQSRQVRRGQELRSLNDELTKTKQKIKSIDNQVKNNNKVLSSLNSTYLEQRELTAGRQQKLEAIRVRLEKFKQKLGSSSGDVGDMESTAASAKKTLITVQTDLNKFLTLLESDASTEGSLLWLMKRIRDGEKT